MITLRFAIWDSAAQAYKPPFYVVSKGIALRAFSDLVNSEGNDISRYPRDFTLFELGTFDDQTGKSVDLPTPKSMGLAQEYLINVDPEGQEGFKEHGFETPQHNETSVLGDPESGNTS